MAELIKREPWFWATFDPQDRRAGADLAALRRGLGREAGSVTGLWRYYRVVIPDHVAAVGLITPELMAEHAALTLFAVHQQSQSRPMHSVGEHIGTALLKLRGRVRSTGDPGTLDRRVDAAATAASAEELVFHLRGLVAHLRRHQLPLDYSQLVQDIADWPTAFGQARVRRRWGANYFAWTRENADDRRLPQTAGR